jgi:transcriptional regulator with AAA-type ATPase domain/tetratricopeptide (TPR) repeat protein
LRKRHIPITEFHLMKPTISPTRKAQATMLFSPDCRQTPDPILITLRALVTRGRYAEAEKVARTRRRRLAPTSTIEFLALRTEIALGLGRFGEALASASEARRGVETSDPFAESLEGQRIRALLGLGRFREASASLDRWTPTAVSPEVDPCLLRGQVALHSGCLSKAAQEAEAACARAMSGRKRRSLIEALLLRARVSRGTGNLAGARTDIDRAHRLCTGLRDIGLFAAVLADRADLRAHAGAWPEAERDALQSARLFARMSSPHEHLSAGRRTGLLNLAQGEPGAALPPIQRAADLARRGFGTVECRAEIDLLLADAQLAGRDAEGALERATAALAFFRHAQDPGGLARAHVRRSLAALSVPNLTLALREARIAGSISHAGPVAKGLADLALGRVLLRKEIASAAAPFDRASKNSGLYPPLLSVARLGLALASGAAPTGDAVQSHIAAIESFGDVRILAILRSDLREMFGMDFGSTASVELGEAEGGWPSEARPEREFLPGLLGESAPVRGVAALVRKAAPSALPVAIYGETGTGKEKVARALHDLSPRREREFVAINAASLSDELFESELFGHLRGSFTGALADRPGLVERARGGTLFIDEVADLSPLSQVRLLRFVQEGQYRRLGDNRERSADVRIVVASNQRLEELVAARRFREDLLHRLRGVCVTLPPLRERGADILRLAREFVRAASSGRARLSPGSETRLLHYAWPGNVRELEQEMRRAVVLAESHSIEWREPDTPAIKPAAALAESVLETDAVRPLQEALMGYERTLLKSALSRCAERAAAARLLGISRQALHQKIVRFGL